jgi:hypothetical protein
VKYPVSSKKQTMKVSFDTCVAAIKFPAKQCTAALANLEIVCHMAMEVKKPKLNIVSLWNKVKGNVWSMFEECFRTKDHKLYEYIVIVLRLLKYLESRVPASSRRDLLKDSANLEDLLLRLSNSFFMDLQSHLKTEVDFSSGDDCTVLADFLVYGRPLASFIRRRNYQSLVRGHFISDCLELNVKAALTSPQISDMIDSMFWGNSSLVSCGKSKSIFAGFPEEFISTLDWAIFIRTRPVMMFFLEGISKLILIVLVAYVTTASYTQTGDDLAAPPLDIAMGLLILFLFTSALYEVGQFRKEHHDPDSVRIAQAVRD